MQVSRLALAIALAPSLTFAATSTDSAQPLLVTRATPLTQPAPASVKVITRAEIERSGAASLTDVLRGQAGLQIRDAIGDGSRATPSLRGFGDNGQNNSLVLVDGRRLNQPSLAGADLSSIPLANIERIEILRGAGTVLYGDQAVGGVVNIITRQPQGSSGEIETGIGSHDLQFTRGHVSQQLGAGFSAYASAETRDGDNYRENNAANYENAFARLRHDHEGGWALVEYQSVDDELQLPGYLSHSQKLRDRNASYAANSNGFNDSKTEVLRMALQQAINEHWNASFDYSFSDQDGVGTYNSAWGSSPFTQGTRSETFSPRLTGQWSNALGRTEWLLGHDHISSDYQYRSAFGATLFQQTQRDWYTQLSQGLAQDWLLTAGYRASEAEDHDQGAATRHTDREGSSSLGLSWQADRQIRVFIKREDVLRWANVDENGFKNPAIDFLKPQTGASWESGVEWKDGVTRLQASLYRLDLDNELMYDPTATGPYGAGTGANINLDQTRRDGLLLEASRNLSADLTLSGQYSFTDSEYRAGNYKGNEVAGVARHTASSALDWRVLDGLDARLEAQYTGSQYLSADDGHAMPRQGGYTLLNFALTHEYREFITRLRVNNLTGKQYNSYASYASWVPGGKAEYPAAEQAVQLSVGYRF